MIYKPDEGQPLVHRTRRCARGIALALVLTLTAVLLTYATLSGEDHTEAKPRPEGAAQRAPVSESAAVPSQNQRPRP